MISSTIKGKNIRKYFDSFPIKAPFRISQRSVFFLIPETTWFIIKVSSRADVGWSLP